MLPPWKKSYDSPRQHIKKQRHYFADKGLYKAFDKCQSYGFSINHVWMWELDQKNGWMLKNWCFWIVMLENSWVSWTARSHQSILKEINPEYSLEGLMLKSQRMRWSWRHWLNGREFEPTLGDSKGQGSPACCHPWGHKELDMTKWRSDEQHLWILTIPVAHLSD